MKNDTTLKILVASIAAFALAFVGMTCWHFPDWIVLVLFIPSLAGMVTVVMTIQNKILHQIGIPINPNVLTTILIVAILLISFLISLLLVALINPSIFMDLTGLGGSGYGESGRLVVGTCSHCHGIGCSWCNGTGSWAYYD